MQNKSLVGSVLSTTFCLSAYVVYVYSILGNNTNWIAVAALIYFLPIFVDFIEDLESTRVSRRNLFFLFIACLIAGILYLVLLLSYLAIINSNGTVNSFFQFLLCFVPIVCIPIKAYPILVGIIQLYNRFVDRQ